MSRRGQWIVVGSIVATLGLLAALAVVYPPPAVGVGIEAPDFKAMNIASGDTVRLKDFRGQVLLVNLWATWCTPCEAEMPEIQRLYDALKPEGLRVLAVSEDEQGTDVVQKWVAQHKLTFDVLHDRSMKVEDLYHAVGLPESFVIDRSGRIVKRVTGFRVHWDDDSQKALFRALLASPAAAPAGKPKPDASD
jgi:peroxiredoxin